MKYLCAVVVVSAAALFLLGSSNRAGDVPILREYHGQMSRQPAGSVVIRSQDEWTKAGLDGIGLKVDFENEMALAAFRGGCCSGGYAITITRVDKTETGLTATVRHKDPGGNESIPMVCTSPFHVVVIARQKGEVTFVK